MVHSSSALTHHTACRLSPVGIKAFLACGEHPAQQIGNDSSICCHIDCMAACNHCSASKLLLNKATYSAAPCGVGESLPLLGSCLVYQGTPPGKVSCRCDQKH